MDSYKSIDVILKKSMFGGGNSLDVEAIYFQACQAMEPCTKDEDLFWAIKSFRSIIGYKDSAQRINECRMILEEQDSNQLRS